MCGRQAAAAAYLGHPQQLKDGFEDWGLMVWGSCFKQTGLVKPMSIEHMISLETIH